MVIVTGRGPPSARIRTSTVARSGRVRVSTRMIARSGRGSIHTVCQMPDVAVYQIPPGSSDCLPRCWSVVSVASATSTRRRTRARPGSGSSTRKGQYPPVWEPMGSPSAKTRHSWSTASKTTATRPPRHCPGTTMSCS